MRQAICFYCGAFIFYRDGESFARNRGGLLHINTCKKLPKKKKEVEKKVEVKLVEELNQAELEIF